LGAKFSQSLAAHEPESIFLYAIASSGMCIYQPATISSLFDGLLPSGMR
jgi:hypothetical protein